MWLPFRKLREEQQEAGSPGENVLQSARLVRLTGCFPVTRELSPGQDILLESTRAAKSHPCTGQHVVWPCQEMRMMTFVFLRTQGPSLSSVFLNREAFILFWEKVAKFLLKFYPVYCRHIKQCSFLVSAPSKFF